MSNLVWCFICDKEVNAESIPIDNRYGGTDGSYTGCSECGSANIGEALICPDCNVVYPAEAVHACPPVEGQ